MKQTHILHDGVLGRAKSAVHRMITLEQWICVIFSAVFMLLMMLQVILRYVFNAPLYGVDECVIALMVWYSALGVVVVYWEKGHAMIGFVIKYTGPRMQRFILLVSELIVVIIAGVLAKYGYELFLLQKATQPVGGMPFNRSFYFALPVVIMGISMLIAGAFRVFETILIEDATRLAEERVSLD